MRREDMLAHVLLCSPHRLVYLLVAKTRSTTTGQCYLEYRLQMETRTLLAPIFGPF